MTNLEESLARDKLIKLRSLLHEARKVAEDLKGLGASVGFRYTATSRHLTDLPHEAVATITTTITL